MRFLARTSIVLFISGSLIAGVTLGLVLGAQSSIGMVEAADDAESALPSQLLDINGRVITEFFSVEKRELIAVEDLPHHLVLATITSEDQNFFQHRGFSFRGTLRALVNNLLGTFFSGGSTITQQVAGSLFDDRTDISYTRKLRELWWAFQLERTWSKQEILGEYLNLAYLGEGTYGVEAASQFYFGHGISDASLAESALLIVQLRSPALYSPIGNPTAARRQQERLLQQMVEEGYVSPQLARLSFNQYWDNYDFTRANTSTALSERADQAPYFSEYVLNLLETQYLLGTLDLYRDGLRVYSTLNLEYQEAAERFLTQGIADANETYRANLESDEQLAENRFTPIVDLLALALDVPELRVVGQRNEFQAQQYYRENLNPVIDLVSLMFGTGPEDELRSATQAVVAEQQDQARRTTVEGALITIENDSGYILSMVGGANFEAANQFNRAAFAEIEPGSAFKPLYYAAAVDAGAITPATLIYDTFRAFENADGSFYVPRNFQDVFVGPVLARQALAQSMNVPSLVVLSRVGFDRALETAGSLLGIPRDEWVNRGFVRRWPVGLGVVSVSPLEMARAYATFANAGRAVEPIAVRYIEDRYGEVIVEPERELRIRQAREGDSQQIISPQSAFVMTDMLQQTVKTGTLANRRRAVGDFNHPMAGKTGTTQNWADAWTVGFSPYYTTAVWLGFDRGGNNSLGANQTGAVTAGPIWAAYTKEIHDGLPPREFQEPATGIVRTVVSRRTGQLPVTDDEALVYEEVFVEGTEPREIDTRTIFEQEQQEELVDRLRDAVFSPSLNLTNSRPQSADLAEGLSFSLPELDWNAPLDADETDGEVSEDDQSNPLLD